MNYEYYSVLMKNELWINNSWRWIMNDRWNELKGVTGFKQVMGMVKMENLMKIWIYEYAMTLKFVNLSHFDKYLSLSL